MKKIVVFGAGGHARVVADAIRACGEEVFGFVDTVAPERKGQPFSNGIIIGGFSDLVKLADTDEVEVGIGFGQCAARYSLIQELKQHEIVLRTIIHPRAIVSPSAQLSAGVYVGPNAVIEADCLIGEGSIINCGAITCHECEIGQAVAVCPGVMVGGKSCIGNKTWLGIGATVIDKITIGSGCIVAAGAVVVSNMPADVLICGVPAKIKRTNTSIF
jgi:sugar O-acyltransferase (sialic acid O-acetyltransferase NeuD family)